MTECNGCGGCCNPVALAVTVSEAMALLPTDSAIPRRPGEQRIDPRTRQWIIHELTPITKRQAVELRPELEGRRTSIRLGDGTYSPRPTRYYRCRWYEEDTRQCTNYENRPDVCRDYPPFGPIPEGMEPGMPLTCSYRADYGLPVEPWTPVALSRKAGENSGNEA